DLDELLAFFDFPAPHWVHLRTTNPIESVFSTVKARTKAARGAGSKTAAIGMAFKLMESASRTWHPLNRAPLVAQVWAGVQFKDGQPPDESTPQTPVTL
ncbi:MAG: transposase, partial [Bifidobacteriaceae bacterium]|nr:transposase [Bifidobacteriaceae bacterium]